MRTIAVVNQKGGCGKTTVSINLSACLAKQGRRVLLVDMDPQGHCALGLAVPEEQIDHSVADLLLQNGSQALEFDRAVWQVSANFDFLPSTLGLVRFEALASDQDNRDQRLRNLLSTVAHRYDYCVVDCPPHVGLLTYNALRACQEAIVPVETGYFSLHGLSKQLDTINDLNTRTGETIRARVLANSYDVRTKLAREVLNELRKQHLNVMFRSYINFNTKLKEGASYGQPITEYDPASMGYRDFDRLARELMEAEQAPPAHDELLLQADRLAARAEELLATRSTLIAHGSGSTSSTALAVRAPVQMPETPRTNHAEIQKKIDQIYGVRQTHNGVEFHTNLPGASEVLLAGDFNNWTPRDTPMCRKGENGHFSTTLALSKGRYRYRLVVDGRWTKDPCNELTEMNEFGEVNSVAEID